MRFPLSLRAVAPFALATLVVTPSLASYNGDIRICNNPLANPRAAEAACTRILKDVRKGIKVPVIYSLRAWARRLLEDFDGTIKDSTMAIELGGPRPAVGYNMRGDSYRSKGEHDKAIAEFTEAMRLEPKWGYPYVNRSILYFDRRDFDKSIDDLNKAIELMPKYATAYNNRGNAWQYKGEYDRAISDYDMAIKLDAKQHRPYMNRGRTWLFKGDMTRALADMKAAIENAKSNRVAEERGASLPLALRGDINRYKGDLIQALADYDEALSIYKDFIYAHTGKGLTYEKMGKPDLARAEFLKAVESKAANRNTDASLEARQTAQARIEAIDAGVGAPNIPFVPIFSSANSIPTPNIQPPSVSAINQARGHRVALVIGNSAYKSVSALANPGKDAAAIATTLRNVGFNSVTLVNNASREQLVTALRDFANEAERSDWAMVYYAGHGMEVGGVNYLIPVDAKIAVDRDIQYEAVPLHQILNAADAAKKIKIVMLDACRDNPFTPRRTAAPEQIAAASTAGAQIATRSTKGRGLAEVKVSGATLVVYAAKDGQVALDGEGGNSPFAVAVVQRIATPGVEINKVFRLVRDDVMEATAGRQEPYTYGSLPGKEDFYFVAK